MFHFEMLPVARFRRISARFFLFSPFRATELAINGGKEPRKERQGGTKGPWGSGSLERGWMALSSMFFIAPDRDPSIDVD